MEKDCCKALPTTIFSHFHFSHFSVIENERFGLVFAKTGSINSGTGSGYSKSFADSTSTRVRHHSAVLWIRNDSGSTFQLVSDRVQKFSDILDINFTCKWVRLLIMTRYKLFREIFFDKKDLTFLN
jgi:hypothetical protein